jgi:4-amino-4-deoxy-L-arabinose transferase-like glycosyltransferase
MTPWLSVGSLGLVATFAPLYGNGKNVLGEVPGLLFVLLFLLCVRYIESGKSTERLFLFAGLMLGLAVVTKPIFLLLLPVVGLVLVCSRELLTIKKVCAAILGFVATFSVWICKS